MGVRPYSCLSDETVYSIQRHVNQQAQANQPGFRPGSQAGIGRYGGPAMERMKADTATIDRSLLPGAPPGLPPSYGHFE